MYDKLTLSEIAWQLEYSSVQHLSRQLKKTTGLTPSHFKKVKENRRKPSTRFNQYLISSIIKQPYLRKQKMI